MQSQEGELEKTSKVAEQCYETQPTSEDRESVLALVERLHHEHWKMTREFERVCRNEQLTYLTPIQVSVKLGITKDTLVRWRKNGRGPLFVKQGGRIVYPSRELESWLQSRRRVQAALEVWGSG
jgi:predicted DNA-binding transcriptional regulator AlpA